MENITSSYFRVCRKTSLRDFLDSQQFLFGHSSPFNHILYGSSLSLSLPMYLIMDLLEVPLNFINRFGNC